MGIKTGKLLLRMLAEGVQCGKPPPGRFRPTGKGTGNLVQQQPQFALPDSVSANLARPVPQEAPETQCCLIF